MSSKQELMDISITRISSMLEKLNAGSELSELECKQIIHDLETLQAIERNSEKGDQNVMDKNIEVLFEDFNTKADDSKGLLQKMLSLVSEGRVPTESEMSDMNMSIEDLRVKYNEIYSCAMAQVSHEEMPPENVSAIEYVDAVRNSASLAYKKQLEELKTIIEEFVLVQSTVESYAEALRPYQLQAEELISRFSNEVALETEELEESVEGPKLFMEALTFEDLDSDEGMDLLDEVGNHYNNRVQRGLTARKYYLPDTKTSDASKQDKDELRTKDEPEERSKTENEDLESSSRTVESEMDEEINEGEKSFSEFAKSVAEAGLLVNESDNFGLLNIDISPNEEKKVTASGFKNDLNSGNKKSIKVFIKDVLLRKAITLDMLCISTGMPYELAVQTSDYLHRKGYLRKCILEPYGEVYCPSPRLIKTLSLKEAAKTASVKPVAKEDWNEVMSFEKTDIASYLVTNTLFYDGIKQFGKNNLTHLSVTNFVLSECFHGGITCSDESSIAYSIVGMFLSKIENCDGLLDDLKEKWGDHKGTNIITFAAFNLEIAKGFAKIVFNTLGGEDSFERVCLYSLSDDSYYSYPDGEYFHFDSIKLENAGVDDNPEEMEDISKGVEKDEEGSEQLDENLTEEEVTADDDFNSNEFNEIGIDTLKTITPDIDYGASDSVDFYESITDLINKGKLYAATAYAKAGSLQNTDYNLFYNQLAHAVNDPMAHCRYSTDNVFTLIDKRGELEDSIVISTALRTFFSNQIRYDYNIKSYYSGIKEYKLLNDYPALSKVLYTLMDFKDRHQRGMDSYADYRFKDKAALEKELQELKREAQNFYDNYVLAQKKETAKQRRFLETKKQIFDVENDIGQFLKAILDGSAEFQPLVIDFLKENFFNEGSTISKDTIDSDMLWDYITVYWEKAGDTMSYRRHADLTSQLRTNITSATTKAVQILARWCDLIDRMGEHLEDDGALEYKRIRKTLLENIEAAIKDFEETCADEAASEQEAAGSRLLVFTLKEIRECIHGSYSEDHKKYYYVPFLLTDDMMLDEDYLPDLDIHSSDLKTLNPMARILTHVDKVVKHNLSLNERLHVILNEKGDDYGQAKLIVDYLLLKDPSDDLNALLDTIESGKDYAKDDADIRKTDFIGNLELAQSYGQIDNSVEDQKEKILQIIDEWYEWAEETFNYGFFNKVLDNYLSEIREAAKGREKNLLEELEVFKSETILGLSAKAKEQRVKRIREMIDDQNYTVAEDLLARSNIVEEEYEELDEEDFLREFLDNYNDYYEPVASKKASFASLVNSRTKNKEQRGAKKLAENWLPGGSRLGEQRLRNLLDCFGFKVESITVEKTIGKYEHFTVKTTKAKGGQRDNYTHPIAALGSGASTEGFRVVCLNGAYTVDGLIEIMKEIGNAKHTIILFDHAMSLRDRRRLARKTKNSLGDKLFAVVDRVVMMYLVRKYDETKMNKMLVSLVVPFGYYQPYVWESSNVMPPEIFMGRKLELEKIKSPTGANIVYGGRQLGKSALLKKAQEDIDKDENGNRAVLIDIKGLTYKEAAKKISQRLFDESILEEDINTEDWNDLARAVRNRLQDEKKRIPYLLLLLDEADVFIESCAAINYQPFDELKDIQSVGAGRFKFVIAGLRNVIRSKKEALGNNSVLTHLEAMTVKPFNTSEARELIETPLKYLGLRFPKDKVSLITLILASTNYFPGLIQMYCANLIDAMRNKDYANYNESDTPIYEVSEEHIKKVLADSKFMKQIREKYEITLRLDEDNYYYLIALLMAFLYHNNGYNKGYSAADIKEAGANLEIGKIANLEDYKLEALMDELMELNVLRITEENRYLFTRFNFFQMMGTSAEVDDKLEEYMGE